MPFCPSRVQQTFNAVTDCSDAAQATFKGQLATGLGNGLTAADITTRCTLPYINVGSRRRLAAAGRVSAAGGG